MISPLLTLELTSRVSTAVRAAQARIGELAQLASPSFDAPPHARARCTAAADLIRRIEMRWYDADAALARYLHGVPGPGAYELADAFDAVAALTREGV